MSFVSEKTSVKVALLTSMYPCIESDVLLDIARESVNIRHAVVKCESIVRPTFRSTATLELFKRQPTVAAKEVGYLVQDMADLMITGPQVGDVPHQEEYVLGSHVVMQDTAAWDEAFLFSGVEGAGPATLPAMDAPGRAIAEVPEMRWLTSHARRGVSAVETCNDNSAALDFDFAEPDLSAAEAFSAVFDATTARCSIARELHAQRDGSLKELDQVVPQVVPLLKSFVEGLTVVPAMEDVAVTLPLLGEVPVSTKEAKIVSATIPPEAARVDITCDTCFRVRLRKIALEIEPIHFSYVRNGVRLPGILFSVVKRAHLRLGMNILVSPSGSADAEIYVAKLSLKKFSLRAQMKYGSVVNAGLTVARNMIKKIVEDELSKALIGVHPLQ